MVNRNQRIMLISVICVVLCVILTIVLILVLPKPEKPPEIKNWWEQDDKVEIVLEDERSVEKSLNFKLYDRKRIEFNYIDDKKNTREFLPSIKIYYEGIEQKLIQKIMYREQYNDNQERYNSVAFIQGIGIYRVGIRFFLNEEDSITMKNTITGIVINILIAEGIE